MRKTKYGYYSLFLIVLFFWIGCSSQNRREIGKTSSNKVIEKGKLHYESKSKGIEKKKEEKKVVNDNKDVNGVDCAKKLAKAYEDYHFWRLDKALLEVDEAMKIIDTYYNKGKDTEIPDKDLKIKKAYRVKSTAHLLRGLILLRKASDYNRISRKEGEKILKEYMKQNKDAEKLPPMKLYEKLKDKIEVVEKKYGKLAIDSVRLAKGEFEKALEIDPTNPDAHYHYGMKVLLASGEKEKAEKELYNSALLYIKEGDKKKAKDILKELKKINIASKYISKIEEALGR